MVNHSVIVAGTGPLNSKTAMSLLDDHLSIKDPTDTSLCLVLDKAHKSSGWLVFDDEDFAFNNIVLYAQTGLEFDDEVMDSVDAIYFIDNPAEMALKHVDESSELLLSWNEEDEDTHVELLKSAQTKGASVFDLSDGLIEIRWEEEEDDEEPEVVVELPKVTAPVEDHSHTDWQTMMEARQATDPTSTRSRVERKIAALLLQLEADIAQVFDEAGL
jgi:hypothetical protein